MAVALGLGVAYFLTSEPPAAPRPNAEQPPQEQGRYEFIPLGSTVANLAEGRLTRYLQVNITLQVERDSAPEVRKLTEDAEAAVFKNWLLTYLSDKQLTDVKGSNSIKRLQREILDGFNAILADHGEHRIDAVLFEEFTIQ
jgi:flagellar basal body-associated protein FliL